MLEKHVVMHYIVVLLFYNSGQALNVLAQAYLASRSSLNSIQSIWEFFKFRWVPIAIRWFVCLCLFLVVWENPSVLNVEKFMPNFASHLGVSGMLGWASDSIFDKVMAVIFPGIQKELPAVPGPDPKPNP